MKNNCQNTSARLINSKIIFFFTRILFALSCEKEFIFMKLFIVKNTLIVNR